jgi:hypothetical protein
MREDMAASVIAQVSIWVAPLARSDSMSAVCLFEKLVPTALVEEMREEICRARPS